MTKSNKLPQLESSSYPKQNFRVGVAHLGVGAFHRTHQAVYFDTLMEQTKDLNWAIAGVNLRSEQSADIKRLQGCAEGYVLKTIPSQADPRYRQIRSHKVFYDWSQDASSVEAVAAPQVQLITITVTEAGYCQGADRGLDLENAEIKDEIAGTRQTSVYAFLRNVLMRRRDSKAGPVTVLCCDNLRENGLLLERNFKAYLEVCGDTSLLGWLDDNVAFPCCMVDRITPKIDATTSEEVAKLFGIEGDISVHAEDFIQWVIEDKFSGLRPDLEVAGASIVADVQPYEEAKIRILNGGHSCLAYLGALKGHATYDAAMRDEELATFFDKYETTEVIPALGEGSPLDLSAYHKTIKERFLNANIADSIERIVQDGVSKMPTFILPTVAGCFACGITPDCAMRAIASWYVFMRLVAQKKMAFYYHEPNWSMVEDVLGPGQEQKFAGYTKLWGDIPERYPQFVSGVCAQISELAVHFPV